MTKIILDIPTEFAVKLEEWSAAEGMTISEYVQWRCELTPGEEAVLLDAMTIMSDHVRGAAERFDAHLANADITSKAAVDARLAAEDARATCPTYDRGQILAELCANVTGRGYDVTNLSDEDFLRFVNGED